MNRRRPSRRRVREREGQFTPAVDVLLDVLAAADESLHMTPHSRQCALAKAMEKDGLVKIGEPTGILAGFDLLRVSLTDRGRELAEGFSVRRGLSEIDFGDDAHGG